MVVAPFRSVFRVDAPGGLPDGLLPMSARPGLGRLGLHQRQR